MVVILPNGEPLIPNCRPGPAVPCIRCGVMIEGGVDFCGSSPETVNIGGTLCQECNRISQTNLREFFIFPKKD